MAYFAQINPDDNTVIQVLKTPDEQEHRGQEYLNEIGLSGTWIQTSYNTRGNKHYVHVPVLSTITINTSPELTIGTILRSTDLNRLLYDFANVQVLSANTNTLVTVDYIISTIGLTGLQQDYSNVPVMTAGPDITNTITIGYTLSADGLSGLRYNYAGIGSKYDSIVDAFYAPVATYPSWLFDSTTYTWVAPKPYPIDGGIYNWNELQNQWTVLVPVSAIKPRVISHTITTDANSGTNITNSTYYSGSSGIN